MTGSVAHQGSFKVGALTITHLSDGVMRGPRRFWFNGIDPAEWVPAVGVESPDAPFTVTFGAFLVTGGERVTLVDSGWGHPAGAMEGLEGGGGMLERLAAVGVGPGDVDLIVQTHLHADHCGWLISDDRGSLSFPDARVLVHGPELDYWFGAEVERHEQNSTMAPFVRQRVETVRAAGRLETFAGEAALSEEASAVLTPGHTPGHVSVLLASRGEHALLLGDVAHHPVHLEHHDWLPAIDHEPKDSARSRAKVAALAAERDALVSAPHFPILTVGRVRRVEDRYAWQPA